MRWPGVLTLLVAPCCISCAVINGVSGGSEVQADSGFVLRDDDTVLDERTGLVWLRNDAAPLRTWEEAVGYCPSSWQDGDLVGRLPTLEELVELYDHLGSSANEDRRVAPFGWTAIGYWSADRGDDAYVWYVSFGDGQARLHWEGGVNGVRCVRGESSGE